MVSDSRDDLKPGGEGADADADADTDAVAVGEDADAALPEVPDPDEPPLRDSNRRRLVTVAKLVLPVMVGAGVIGIGFASQGEVRQAAGLVRHVRLRWVWLAAACEVAQFTALTLHVRYLSGPRGNTRRVGPARTALVVFGLGAVLPAAPAEGLAMAGSAMVNRGLARRRIALVLGLSQWFNNAALYLVAAVSALVFVAVAGVPFPHQWMVIAAAIATLAFFGSITFLSTRSVTAEWIALALDRLRWWRRPRPSPSDSRARGAAWHAAAAHVISGRRGMVILVTTAAAAWLADALCLHVALLAFGVHVSLVVLLFAYSVGTLAAAVPFLPAGVGAVETATPAVLALANVPVQTALAAIVVYRAFSTLAPAAAGALALIGLKLEDPERTTDQADEVGQLGRPPTESAAVPAAVARKPVMRGLRGRQAGWSQFARRKLAKAPVGDAALLGDGLPLVPLAGDALGSRVVDNSRPHDPMSFGERP